MVYAIDGRERWLVHNYMKPGEGDFDAVDRDACLRTILGVDADFNYEIISKEDWYGRRLIAEQVPRPLRFHRRRCRPYLGALCRLRHERRHCGRHEPVVAAGRPSQRLGAAVHSRCLRGGALADHQPGFAVCDVACGSRNPPPRRGARRDRGCGAGRASACAARGRASHLRDQRPAICLRRPQFRHLLRSLADHRL